MKRLLKIIEYLSVFAFLLALCLFINKGIVLKGLFKDDLFHWSWYRGLNLYDFAIKFYPSSKYRPAFEIIQYIIYTIVGTDVFKFTLINKVYNSIIALFVYHVVRRLDVNKVISLCIASMYIVAHYAYYQIAQGIGSLESDALFFALIILFYCLKLSGAISCKNGTTTKKDNILNIIILLIMYFVISFTHERYMCLAAPIVVVLFSIKNDGNNVDTKEKIVPALALIVEILIICIIRYMAIGRVMPTGTGGTNVEETFRLTECIEYCFSQVAIILGINIGPDHLCGVDFVSLPNDIVRILTLVSIMLIVLFILIYITIRVKVDTNESANATDLIFLLFIASCIAASSVTIRVELRFVYVSFVVALIYLSYMHSFIKSNVDFKIAVIVLSGLIVLILAFRLPIELEYRKYFPKIYCFVDTHRVNSIYENTIEKYGLDEILHNKKVYIIDEYFGMTSFYAEYFFKIYDKDNVGNNIILVKKLDEIPNEDINNKDVIILYENLALNKYSAME